MQLLILATLATVAASMPSYIAVPADQIAFVDLRQLRARRVPRQTLTPPPPPPVPQLSEGLYSQNYQPIPLHYEQQTVALAPPPEPEQPRPARLQLAPDSHHAGTAAYEERPPDFGEYVDFGAHTGDNGAFGWYADFPVNNHDDSSSY